MSNIIFMQQTPTQQTPTQKVITSNQSVSKTVYPILFTVSFSHLVNDMLQSVIPSVYPLLKTSYGLSFTQIGLITLTYQLMASILQPFVGSFTDKKPTPFSLPVGMLFSLGGMIALAMASDFGTILLAVSVVGIGSSIFHPESSRVAYLASGGRRGLAQSIFQIGGNAGSAIGPLVVALLIIPNGQSAILWFVLIALVGVIALLKVGTWYRAHLIVRSKKQQAVSEIAPTLSPSRIRWSIIILLVLIFSKYFYMASMTSYFTFFMIDKFNVSVQQSQIYLFGFLAAVAAGTFFGGPLGDRFGRKYIIWFSILGTSPFALFLPHANLFWTAVLAIVIGFILASAFSAILVYAQELLPGKVGMISGLFFGFAFGMGGLGSAVLGTVADHTSINFVFSLCAYLPLIGILTYFLPNVKKPKQ
ncbi:MFS transporter [Olivibacter sp. SDN3]|uniref:MFS transporter n=1 Tax=Olivibacter sp. SDN3 TaxID=2764720 RepID=UPI00272E7653|nr:MFS transporter [Olivibacter sp. SDN3]